MEHDARRGGIGPVGVGDEHHAIGGRVERLERVRVLNQLEVVAIELAEAIKRKRNVHAVGLLEPHLVALDTFERGFELAFARAVGPETQRLFGQVRCSGEHSANEHTDTQRKLGNGAHGKLSGM